MNHNNTQSSGGNATESADAASADAEPVDADEHGEGGAEIDAEAADGTLRFSDSVAVETTPEQLWSTISDPATLTECVPGAESIERVSERKYTVEITRGVSHLTVSLSGEAEFVEMNPPDTVVTSATAFDSKTGSDFDILAGMEIQPTDDGGAELAYTAEVSISGGVGTMSPRILRPIVNRDIETYFGNVKSAVEGE
ncbi:SRPBCC domain-containing protein [Halorubrum sp. CBA1229]|jgi:carbon monoxide dehydrogenase subunit G|uniref:CoxG family protein n=1 Tax=Halorubrum sp. CBA1229 TaxID=1853699 RepID=UPI000F3E4A33|nr:SRPBCC domain-containing protein [Halorubrum sp. CBA1229]QKY15491.1 SRPBCC family protein [Halorubrum sp. CBA1229]